MGKISETFSAEERSYSSYVFANSAFILGVYCRRRVKVKWREYCPENHHKLGKTLASTSRAYASPRLNWTRFRKSERPMFALSMTLAIDL